MNHRELLCVGLVLSTALVSGCSDPPPPPDPPQPAPSAEVDVAVHNAAVAAMGRYDYADAFELLAELDQRYPRWPDGQVDLAIAQLNRQQEGDEAAALARAQAVQAIASDNLRAWYVSGLLRMNAGDAQGALADFMRVAEADSTDAYAAYYTGQALSQLGQPDQALPWFERAIDINPYLRSSYYAASQAARRCGDSAAADAHLATFQRMEHNPRAQLAELKYTRMGPKANVSSIAGPQQAGVVPDGPLFSTVEVIAGIQDAGQWASLAATRVMDRPVVLACGDSSLVLLHRTGDQWATTPWPEQVDGVRGAMFGDVNEDGHVDAVLLRDGPDQLWLGGEGLRFTRDDRFMHVLQDATADGALFDADHDGDLDVLTLTDDGVLHLLNNNGNGTWRDISSEAWGTQQQSSGGRQVVIADLDADLDSDVIVVRDDGCEVWVNDRLWAWRASPAVYDAFARTVPEALIASDIDADGVVDLVACSPDGVQAWSRTADGFTARPCFGEAACTGAAMAIVDMDGDGAVDLVHAADGHRIGVTRRDGTAVGDTDMPPIWTVVNTVQGQGVSLIGINSAGDVHMAAPGAGRFTFVDVQLAGRVDEGQSMRSNASGIGATIAARSGLRWTMAGGVRATAGPGQNLQPLAIGLGGAPALDFVSIDWTDGVFQTEAMVAPGQMHTIVETQRQLSSCPVIFGFNGTEMAFITDCLGVGGIGFFLAPDTFAPSRGHERVVLPDGALQPRHGRIDVVIAEPMQETCYLDDVSLLAVDVPAGWEVLPDERMGTGGDEPTGDLLFSRHSMQPTVVRTDDDRDVTAAVLEVDGVPADPGPLHRRFIGRTVDPLVFTAWFDAALDSHAGTPLMVIDGWVEYPYGQTMFAAWQADVAYDPISVEVQLPGGLWVQVADRVGYPAGMPRTMVLPLHDLPKGAHNLRVRTTLAMSVDAIRIAWSEPCAAAEVTSCVPAVAELFDAGFPRAWHDTHGRPQFDWHDRSPWWDTRTQRGMYSALGDVRQLVLDRDGVQAVFGAGDAIALQFDAPADASTGFTRQWVLDVGGWAKDMDLMTRTGATVAPLPGERDARGQALQEATQTRWRDGR